MLALLLALLLARPSCEAAWTTTAGALIGGVQGIDVLGRRSRAVRTQAQVLVEQEYLRVETPLCGTW